MTNALPPYPASSGPSAARRLRERAIALRDAADDLREQIVSTETAFTGRLAQEDERTTTQSRIAALAKEARKRPRK